MRVRISRKCFPHVIQRRIASGGSDLNISRLLLQRLFPDGTRGEGRQFFSGEKAPQAISIFARANRLRRAPVERGFRAGSQLRDIGPRIAFGRTSVVDETQHSIGRCIR